MTTLMIAGGGTGGHIYPAIAIAREFVARDAKRRVVFVGTERGLEKTIVPKAGFPLEVISVGGLKGKGLGETLQNLARLPFGFVQAWKLVGNPVNIALSNNGKNVDFDLGSCVAPGTGVATLAVHFINGNEFCAAVTR